MRVLHAATWLIGLVVAARAWAQVAPEGNAHPEHAPINEMGRSAGNPFGPAEAWVTGVDEAVRREGVGRKVAFARDVDLGPLRRAAVFHNGRVKILETLARETVRGVTGRGRYEDLVLAPARDASPEVFKHDPLFTLLDFIIDPAYYGDKALIHVEYLDLRREIVEGAMPVPSDASPEGTASARARREWFLRSTRVSPEMLVRTLASIAQAHMTEPVYRDAINRIDESATLFQMSQANLMLGVPAHRGEAYAHLADLPENSPARVAALSLGNAWRAGDAPGVNQAAIDLAEALRAINPAIYPSGSLELAYSTYRPFDWGVWLYALSLVLLVIAFGTGRRGVGAAGIGVLVGAVATHAAGFTARCVIAERFAIQNQFESMTGLSLFAALVALGIMLVRRQWLFGAAAAGVGFLVLVGATQTGIPGRDIEREAAILNTSWLLKYHVTTVLLSYGLIALGFLVSVFYLGVHFGPRFAGVVGLGGGAPAQGGAPGARERALHDLDTAQMVVLQLAFWALLVGILLGAWWADHSWGRFWAFDPKETWALVTWIIYLIVIHVRLVATRRGLVTAWLSVLGFVVMLWTFFGVNLLLPGLHAYA